MLGWWKVVHDFESFYDFLFTGHMNMMNVIYTDGRIGWVMTLGKYQHWTLSAWWLDDCLSEQRRDGYGHKLLHCHQAKLDALLIIITNTIIMHANI